MWVICESWVIGYLPWPGHQPANLACRRRRPSDRRRGCPRRPLGCQRAVQRATATREHDGRVIRWVSHNDGGGSYGVGHTMGEICATGLSTAGTLLRSQSHGTAQAHHGHSTVTAQPQYSTGTVQSQHSHNTATVPVQRATAQSQHSHNTATTQPQYSHNTATTQPQYLCSGPQQPGNTSALQPA